MISTGRFLHQSMDSSMHHAGSQVGEKPITDHLEYASCFNSEIAIDLESIQLSPGKAQVQLEQLDLQEVGLQLSATSMKLADFSEYKIPAGYTAVVLGSAAQGHFQNGYHCEGTSIAVLPGGRGYFTRYPQGWNSVDLLLSDELLFRLPVLQRLFDASPVAAPLVSARAEEQSLSFAAGLMALMDSKATLEDERTSDFSTRFCDELERLLSAAFPAGQGSGHCRLSRRADVFAEALDCMEQTQAVPTNAEALARELGVSYRLLNYVFRDAIGLSPYQFLLIKRLHRVRAGIGSGSVPIDLLADKQGFETPSRFRHHYRRLFGEAPSETRANAQV
jgi:methylphosphotriester-DNA--protein-cysteine methyltransferase